MSQPDSADLRERVLVACERGDLPQVEIARRFQGCPATVSIWLRQEREEGRRAAKPHSGGVPSRLDAAVLEVLRQLVIEDNDALLREYRERLDEGTGVTVCLAVICEALKRLKLRPKKKTLRAAEQERPEIAVEREAYRQQTNELPVERLVFLDESGVTTKMARTHARAPRGLRAYGSIPLGSWQRLTVLGALACEGLVATMSIEASTSTPVLLAYLEQVPVPALKRTKPDAILVMDTLRPHHATDVQKLLDRAGIGLLYLPRYSSEFNPIEQAWAKMKERLKAKAPRCSLTRLAPLRHELLSNLTHRRLTAANSTFSPLHDDL